MSCDHSGAEDLYGSHGGFTTWCPACGGVRSSTFESINEWRLPTNPPVRTTVAFVDRRGAGEGPWTVLVDGEAAIDDLPSSHMDVSDGALLPLWEALGVQVTFQWNEEQVP